MSAPLCPKMLATLPHIVHHDSADPHPARSNAEPEQCRCRGSECALWVPEMADSNGDASPLRTTHESMALSIAWGQLGALLGNMIERIDATGCTLLDKSIKPTGRGWCSENLRRQPWTDPAADNDNSAADGGGEDA